MGEHEGSSFRDAMPVGIVVERRRLNNPWQDEAWLPVSVVAGASTGGWRVLHEDDQRLTAYAGTLPVELFRKETASYKYNLETVAPDEAQASLEGGDDIVEGVAMPSAMIEWVAAFIAAHHVEEPTYKRQRQPHQEAKPTLPRGAG